MNYSHVYQSLIRSIYARYNPVKLDEVEQLFQKYSGRERELFENIAKKYNVGTEELNQYLDYYKNIYPPTKSGSWRIALIVLGILIAMAVGSILLKNLLEAFDL